jgi:hypothetical protein
VAERTLLTERIQLGFEATPGVAATVSRRLLSANIDFSPDGDVDVFRPSGSKFASISSLGREWSEGDLEGKPTYDEMYVWLCMNLGAPTTTVDPNADAPAAREHVWPVKAFDPQEPRTATLERGSSVRAQRALHMYLNSIGLEYSRSAIDLSGDIMARAIEDGIALTGGATDFPLIPVLPKDTSIYLDTTLAGIGTTKLLRAIEAEWSLGDRFGQVWPINSALDSFAAIYDAEPDAEVNLTLEADAAGMALLPVLRAGDMRYVRIETIGPVIDGATEYMLRCDFSVKAREFPDYGDEDDLMTIEWPFGMFVDAAWGVGQVGEITLINTTAAIAGTP